jgi:hypothetical protein
MDEQVEPEDFESGVDEQRWGETVQLTQGARLCLEEHFSEF